MADDSLGYDQGVSNDEITFTFEDGVGDNVINDDFDFDFAVEDPQSAESEPVQAEAAGVTGGDDRGSGENDYDDNDDISTAQDDGRAESSVSQGEVVESNQDADDLDEIDYDEDNFGDVAETGSQSAQESGGEAGETTQQDGVEQSVDEIDLGLDHPTDDLNTGAYQAADFGALDKDLDVSFRGVPEHSQMEEIVDNTLDTDGEGLDIDTGALGYTGLPPDVSVTWGSEVCPLFKTAESDDPESFFLDDVGVLDLPLSGFLTTIRGSISKWLKESDEIHIRINELGIEFGETTTDALLGQSTFGHLVALHNVLLKNEDPTATGGLSLTLTTRPNCTLRIKELVEAANSGKGLSAIQFQSLSSGESSHDAYDGDDSPDIISDAIPDDAADIEVHIRDNHSPTEGDYADGDAQDDLIDYEDPGHDGEFAGGEEEHDDNEQQDFMDPIEHHEEVEVVNDVPDEDYEAVQSQGNDDKDDLDDLGAATPAGGTELDFLNYDGEEPQEDSAAVGPLDFAGELDISQGDAGQLSNGSNNPGIYGNSGTNGQAQRLDDAGVRDDDEYLDLDGDIEQRAPVEDDDGLLGGTNGMAAEAAESPTAPGANTSQRASTTPTIGEDEIDYEDEPTPMHSSAAAGAAPSKPNESKEDEIDWDDEDKMLAPIAALPPTSNIPTKRSRDGDEGDVPRGDGHDAKRQRPEHVES